MIMNLIFKILCRSIRVNLVLYSVEINFTDLFENFLGISFKLQLFKHKMNIVLD